MSVSVLYISMSLDGYIADSGDRLGGEDGNRLHEWFVFTSDGEIRADGPAAAVLDEAMATGAVLVGRRTAEIVDHWGGDHHGRGVPIFVPSHRPPPPSVATMATGCTIGSCSLRTGSSGRTGRPEN